MGRLDLSRQIGKPAAHDPADALDFGPGAGVFRRWGAGAALGGRVIGRGFGHHGITVDRFGYFNNNCYKVNSNFIIINLMGE